MMISRNGRLCLPGNQQMKFGQAMAGRPVTVWADLRSIHVLLAGELIRTRPSRLTPDGLEALRLHGGRPADPEPAASALPPGPLPAAQAVEVDRTVDRDGYINLAGHRLRVDVNLTGQHVTLRVDGHLLHVIGNDRLARTLPAPIVPERAARLPGARPSQGPLPPLAQPLRAQRQVTADRIAMVAGQKLRVGRQHAGKTVTVVIEDTVFRVLHNNIELSTHARKDNKPVTIYHHIGKRRRWLRRTVQQLRKPSTITRNRPPAPGAVPSRLSRNLTYGEDLRPPTCAAGRQYRDAVASNGPRDSTST